MAECGASLAELRKDGNFSEKVRYRGSLITKRCDCRNSNGLDPVCKCTYKPPAPKSKATRSEASVLAAAPPPRRIFTKTTQAPIPNFKAISPRTGVNLNGDTIPIPARYKYRRFPAAADPNSQLHWMVRPETPPGPARSPKNFYKFEEPVPHHRRTPMMPGTDENVVRSSLMAETTHAENTDNFHGPEMKAGNFRAESSTCSGNPSHEANYMYRTKRGHDYEQINNQPRQNNDAARPALPPQEHVRSQEASAHPSQARAPAAHPTPEPVPRATQESQPAQPQVPASHSVQEAHPVPAQAPASNSVQESHPVPAQAPASNSVQESHPVPAQAPASNSVHEAHPVPAQALASNSVHETHSGPALKVPASHSAQETTSAQPSHAPAAMSQCAKETNQPFHPYHESVPASASDPVSVATATRVPPREAAPTPVEDRPPTPMPAQDGFAHVLDAASTRDSVAAPQTHVPHPQPEQRDTPLCSDRLYSYAHC